MVKLDDMKKIHSIYMDKKIDEDQKMIQIGFIDPDWNNNRVYSETCLLRMRKFRGLYWTITFLFILSVNNGLMWGCENLGIFGFLLLVPIVVSGIFLMLWSLGTEESYKYIEEGMFFYELGIKSSPKSSKV